MTTSITSRLEYRDYLDDTFDSEVVGNLVGNALVDIVEDRFTWTLEDTFGQSTQNQFAPVTPDNRENVNYLSTGPDFTLSFLGARNKLVLRRPLCRRELRIQRSRQPAHSMVNSHCSAICPTPPTRRINLTTEQVTFDDAVLFTDFDRNEAFLNYSRMRRAPTCRSTPASPRSSSGGETSSDTGSAGSSSRGTPLRR